MVIHIFSHNFPNFKGFHFYANRVELRSFYEKFILFDYISYPNLKHLKIKFTRTFYEKFQFKFAQKIYFT